MLAKTEQSMLKKAFPYILTILVTLAGGTGGKIAYDSSQSSTSCPTKYSLDSALTATNFRIDKVEDKVDNMEGVLIEIKQDMRESRNDQKQVLYLIQRK